MAGEKALWLLFLLVSKVHAIQGLKTTHKKTLPLSTITKNGIKPLQPFNESKAYLLKNRNLTHDDLWLGAKNFRVLTRYNNSTSYGMAIHLIAEHLKDSL